MAVAKELPKPSQHRGANKFVHATRLHARHCYALLDLVYTLNS